MIWKITTAVFVTTTLILLVREEGRTSVSPARPESRLVPEMPDRDPFPEAPPEEPGVERADTVDAEGDAEIDVPATAEDPWALARRLLIRPNGEAARVSKSEWALLRARRDDVMPVLEDWIGRADDLRKAGIPPVTVLTAYARVGGAKAIPLLRNLLLARTPPVRGAWHALRELLDEPEAIEVLGRYQSSLDPGVLAENPDFLWQASELGRALVLEWAASPPAGHPDLRKTCRETIFRRGSAGERERIWSTREGHEVAELWTEIDPRWPPPWPGRLREETLSRLGAADSWTRFRGMRQVALHPDLFTAEIVTRVEDRLRRDLQVERPQGVEHLDSYRRSLTWARDRLAAHQRAAARARDVEEALRPR